MQFKSIFSLFVIFSIIINVYGDNDKALKYLKICLKKPESKYLFDHLYDSWSDENTTLEKELEKRLKDKEDPACRQLLLRLYEKEGRDAEALAACEKLLKKTPKNSTLLYIKARLEFNEHDYEQAIEDLQQALKDKKLRRKNAVQIKKMLGRAYLRIDKEKEALAVWKKLYSDNKDIEFGEDVLQLMLTEGLYEEGMSFCETLIKDSNNKFQKLELSIKLAEILNLKGSRKKSLKKYRELLTQTGTGSWLEKEIFSRISQIFNSEDDSEGLIKFTGEFVKQNPARSAIRLRYIAMLFTAGEKSKALESYRELIKKAPLNKEYRIAYAKMLVKTEKYKEAAQIYAGLIKRFPKNSELVFSKALIEVKADNKKAVLDDIKAYIALNSDSEYAYIRAAKLLENAEMNKEAGEFYKSFIHKFSDSVDAVESYALWLFKNDKQKEAVKLLTEKKKLPLAIILRRSKIMLNHKLIKEALAYLQGFTQEYSKDFRYNEELFTCAAATGNKKQYLELIPEMVSSALTWDELKRAISSTCYVLSKNNSSEKYLDKIKIQKNLSPNMLCLQAVMQSRLFGDQVALDTLEKSIALYPDKLMLYRQKAALLKSAGEYSKAVDVWKLLLKKDKKARATIYKELVKLCTSSDQGDEALKWASRLKRDFPNSVTSWTLYARMLQQNNKTQEAVKTLGRAVYRFPNNDQIRQQLVEAYSKKGNMKGAINICWKILRRSNNIGGKLGMIEKIFRLSNTEDLKETLKSRLKLQMKNNPKDVFPLLALAEIARLSYNQNEYREYIQKATKVGKKSTYLLNKLAEVDEEQGNYAEAERILQKLCEEDKTGKAKIKLANFYFRAGDDRKAMEICQEYIREHKDEKSVINFASDMICRKMPEQALKVLQPYAAANDNCDIHYLLGCAYEDLDKYNEAKKEFMKVIKLSSSLKDKAKKTTVPQRYYHWSPQLPDSVMKLSRIRNLRWQVYRYRQQRGRHYSLSSMPGTGMTMGILLPTSAEDAKLMAICHLGSLVVKLDKSEKEQLVKFLGASGIKYPEMALIAAEARPDKASIDFKKILEKYKDNIDLKLYLYGSYFKQMQNALGQDAFRKVLIEIVDKRPKHATGLIYQLARSNIKDKKEIIEKIFAYVSKAEKLPMQYIGLLGYMLNDTKFKWTKKQEEEIKTLLVKNFIRIRKDNPNVQPYIVVGLISALLKKSYTEDAVKIIKSELKNKAYKNQYQGIFYSHHRTNQGLDLAKQPFPTGKLIKLHPILVSIYGRRYGIPVNEKKAFYKACKDFDNLEVRLLALNALKDKAGAEKAATALAADSKATLAGLALAASWFFHAEMPDKAYATLLKARRFVKSKAERKELNCRLLTYALKIKDAKKQKDAILDTGQKLLRLNLNVQEKISLASAYQLADLDKEAEKIENELLKKRRSSNPSSTARRRYSSHDVFTKAEQKFKDQQPDKAINILLREYYREFRQLYNSFTKGMGRGYYQPYNLRRIAKLIKSYQSQDVMLKRLKPKASSMAVKYCEYAYACQAFEKTDLAQKAYSEAVKKFPSNSFAKFHYALILSKKDLKAAIKLFDKVALNNLIMFLNSSRETFANADEYLDFIEMFIKKMKTTKKL